MSKIIAYTDGACSGNPGGGGWAAMIDDDLQSGRFPCTTNNAMEMFAILMACEMCPSYSDLIVYTDSKVSINWLYKRTQCRLDHIKPTRQAIYNTVKAKEIRLILRHVKGHNGDLCNHKVDRAAYAQAQIQKKQN